MIELLIFNTSFWNWPNSCRFKVVLKLFLLLNRLLNIIHWVWHFLSSQIILDLLWLWYLNIFFLKAFSPKYIIVKMREDSWLIFSLRRSWSDSSYLIWVGSCCPISSRVSTYDILCIKRPVFYLLSVLWVIRIRWKYFIHSFLSCPRSIYNTCSPTIFIRLLSLQIQILHHVINLLHIVGSSWCLNRYKFLIDIINIHWVSWQVFGMMIYSRLCASNIL